MIDEYYRRRYNTKIILFENKRYINNLNLKQASIHTAIKKDKSEVYVDIITERIVDPSKIVDKSKI